MNMRGPFKAVVRWWHWGNGNGHAQGARTPAAKEAVAPRKAAPPEPLWLAQLDRLGIPRTLQYPTTTLARILDQSADRFGEATALVFGQKRWTYRDLLSLVNRMAGGLSRLGVRRGDRVVLALPNCPEYVISFFAIHKLGAVVVNAGPLLGADDLAKLVGLTNPRVMIGLDLQAKKLVGAARHSTVDHFVWATLQSYQTLVRRMGYQFKLWQGRERSNRARQAADRRVGAGRDCHLAANQRHDRFAEAGTALASQSPVQRHAGRRCHGRPCGSGARSDAVADVSCLRADDGSDPADLFGRHNHSHDAL
jgi:hypothetical protein